MTKESNENDISVAVVIPARNAAATIRGTLDSLITQSFKDWEAVVVDNGSTDATRGIADEYANRDSRIRVVQGLGRGVSAARNVGIAATTNPWLLFLDADDTIAPNMLARMMEALAIERSADAAHCGWTFTNSTGQSIRNGRCEESGADLFPLFARNCVFCIHACVIRRAAVLDAGGFDESLHICEDFDLWQRVARLGARFVSVPEALVTYRLRQQASWFDAESFLRNALLVVRRGHESDPRIAQRTTTGRHASGAPVSGLLQAEFNMLAWAGAIAISRGENASSLLGLVTRSTEPKVDANGIAYTLSYAIPVAHCQPSTEWPSLWRRIEEPLTDFLTAVEHWAGTPMLARRILRSLELNVLAEIAAHAPEILIPRVPVKIGTTTGLAIEVTDSIFDVNLTDVDRLFIVIYCEGARLGTLLLPVFNELVPKAVIADAIVGKHAWDIIRSLFEHQIYPTLEIAHESDGWQISRAGVQLASGLQNYPNASGCLHDEVGWTIFLQELTGLRDWRREQLYDPSVAQPDNETTVRSASYFNRVELSDQLSSITGTAGKPVVVEGTVGGAPVSTMTMSGLLYQLSYAGILKKMARGD